MNPREQGQDREGKEVEMRGIKILHLEDHNNLNQCKYVMP